MTAEIQFPQIDHPIYDIHRSYSENVARGPCFENPIPLRKIPSEKQWIEFMGCKAASPLGVPAGPLLNSSWTSLAAKLGFDIVAYKTIRSRAHPGLPMPNVIFVKEGQGQIAIEAEQPASECDISITNSFGMPSMTPEFLQKDIAKARRLLNKGQILIVSVVGSPGFSKELSEDFVRAALMAKEAGAQIIEANFSCPNVSSKEGSLFCDPESSYQIASILAAAIKPLPLLVKVGKYPNLELLRKTLIALSKANVRGVCGINGISMRVLDAKQEPVSGKGRETSGVCGNLIRSQALQFVKDASEIISQERLDLELAGCGGVMLPEHFDEFLQAGAKIVMSATGMMWDPYLALKWHKQKQQKMNHERYSPAAL